MTRHEISLNDRYDLEQHQVLLNGTQALVRMLLMQATRDQVAGYNTAGYVTGYRGSPLGAVDFQMQKAKASLDAAQITFQEGLNEDLAATALWGTQQAHLRGENKYDGVFGLWYGKGPGVDRSGDVFRHANMAGTAPTGGVVAALGDDHTGESSTSLHQSELTMIDSFMPVLSPAGVQEVLDFGLTGIAMSRFAGVWTGLKCMKDTIEVTSVVNGDPQRLQLITPEFEGPDGGLHIRLVDTPQAQEDRTVRFKRAAAQAFARSNRLDKRVWGRAGAKIGFVAAGKNWLDLTHAISLLGIDADRASDLGLTTYKVAMTWPLENESFLKWAEGLDLIVVVEEKRKLIEGQIKELLFGRRNCPRVVGGKTEDGAVFLPEVSALDPMYIAEKLGGLLIDEGLGSDALQAAMTKLSEAKRADNAPTLASRLPYFCSGCPHNSSTKVPTGSRAYAGIGCHYMVQWMDRDTMGFTHMGGEGANWIGEAPFSIRNHVFQNIGDGTYNHSGVQAIRAALLAETTITYKILFNDAVAMTGGQKNDGDLDAQRICAEVQAMGVKNVALVYDNKEEIEISTVPAGVQTFTRDHLPTVQQNFAKLKGVSVIVYAQTCAAEKRRRRKRGEFPDPDRRLFINPEVCEGCGDCGAQSNCVSLLPVETPLGRKRAIDQSSCNKDFSCINGFCPSFVSVSGAALRKKSADIIDFGTLPDPKLPRINGTHNLVITGVGGTGAVTLGAVLAMAAHIDGKGAGMMEMAGLAQKGGAVHIHCRIANCPDDISAIRVATGECDGLIGGDLIVSAQGSTLGLLAPGSAKAVVNNHHAITGEFTRNTEFRIPHEDLEVSLQARLKDRLRLFDATALAEKMLGDTVYANMITLGASFQEGLLPLLEKSILKAIDLNGAKVAENKYAFTLGRVAMARPERLDAKTAEPSQIPIDPSAARAAHVQAYGGDKLLEKFNNLLEPFQGTALRDDIEKSLTKVLTFKDEYEVARLLLNTRAQVAAEFEDGFQLQYHLSPPFLPGKTPNGRPRKRTFGGWFPVLARVLTKLKGLRGTPFDPFGYTAERRMERRWIAQYIEDLKVLETTDPNYLSDLQQELAKIPQNVRGFGPVKLANSEAMDKRRAELLVQLQSGEAIPNALAAE